MSDALQPTTRPIEQLISDAPAWPLVLGWIEEAKNTVEILACEPESGRSSLHETQVTTRSPMGAIVYQTGGILIGGGLIRILGAGCPKLERSLPRWSRGKAPIVSGRPGFLLIADDVFGGFYALNGGYWSEHPLGSVLYFEPRSLRWESFAESYTEFLLHMLNTDLSVFYADLRWEGCEPVVASVAPDQCLNFYPPLWTVEGKDVSKVSRRAVPVAESFDAQMDIEAQLRGR